MIIFFNFLIKGFLFFIYTLHLKTKFIILIINSLFLAHLQYQSNYCLSFLSLTFKFFKFDLYSAFLILQFLAPFPLIFYHEFLYVFIILSFIFLSFTYSFLIHLIILNFHLAIILIIKFNFHNFLIHSFVYLYKYLYLLFIIPNFLYSFKILHDILLFVILKLQFFLLKLNFLY